MSYILDALKKSDQERKQGDVPNLQTVHIPVTQEAVSARWPYIVIVLLMLSLAFVMGLLQPWHKKSEQPVMPSADKIIEAYESKQDAIINKQAEKERPVVESTKQNIEDSYKPGNLPITDESVNTAESPLHDVNSVPHLQDLPSLVQQAIPEMIFAGHVFSSNVDQRSVIINDSYMNEGDIIIDGLKIEQITQSGIVFNYNGQLFRMDILQNWSFE